MRVIFGISVAFLLLFLATSAIVFLYDRLGGLSIWNSPNWQTVKMPVIIIAVIMGITLLLVVNYRSTKKFERTQGEFALSKGWGYIVRGNDPEGVIEKIEAKLGKVFPEKEYNIIRLMTINEWNERLSLFDCGYNSRRARTKMHYGSACFIESDRLGYMRSQVEIIPRTGVDSALMLNQVDMGYSEFARNYIVSSKNSDEALKAVNGSIQAVLLQQKNMSSPITYNFEITLGTGGAIILKYSQALQEDWLAMLDMARRLQPALR
jgi:hypothetical protein